MEQQTSVRRSVAKDKKAAKPVVYYATGKRKTSAARVFLSAGEGEFKINGRKLQDYVPLLNRRTVLLAPLEVTNTQKQFNARITVRGGGSSSQVGAIRHGITRALLKVDSEAYRPALKKAGFITRDSRMVERKKYGQHKARKSTQYSKR